MKRFLFFSLLIMPSAILLAQSTEETAIKALMTKQVAAWNNGNIDDFMKGYWNNDSLAFVSQNGVTYGYKNTLDHYKKKYDSPAKMGKLFFSDLKLMRLSDKYYFITGKWFLKRAAGDVGGYYTLLFRKINGQWVIINDHTS